MRKFIQQYTQSSIIAMICGLVTILLGVWTGLAGWGKLAPGADPGTGQNVSYITISLTIVINLCLHVHGYIVNKRDGNRQANVLAISIVEAGYTAFLGTFFWELLRTPGKMNWQIL